MGANDMSKSKPWERLEKEGEKPFAYFLWFRDHSNGRGQERSIDKTAEHFGKSPRTLYHYSRDFRWIERAKAWDDRIAQAQDKAVITAAEKLTAEHLKSLSLLRALGNTTIARALKAAQANEKKLPSTVREGIAALERAVTLERLVTGEATSRTEESLDTSKLSPEDAATLLELLKKAGHAG
jgi:hypothetical protein